MYSFAVLYECPICLVKFSHGVSISLASVAVCYDAVANSNEVLMFALFRFAPVISAYTVQCVSRFLFAISEYRYQ